MKIQYCSDLHLEMTDNLDFIEENPIEVCWDILIIAGDFLPISKKHFFEKEVEKICKPFQKVFWLPGNHEYYHGTYRKAIDKGLTVNPFPQIPNLYMVDNHIETIAKKRLIFSTMWSYIRPENTMAIERGMNHFHVISKIDEENEETNRLKSGDYNKMHQIGIDFIREEVINVNIEIKESLIDKTIVITHHVTTKINYPEQYLNSSLNDSFAVELSDYIAKSGVDFWINGHHHSNHAAFDIGNTRILTNQLGYVRFDEHLDFDWKNFIEV